MMLSVLRQSYGNLSRLFFLSVSRDMAEKGEEKRAGEKEQKFVRWKSS